MAAILLAVGADSERLADLEAKLPDLRRAGLGPVALMDRAVVRGTPFIDGRSRRRRASGGGELMSRNARKRARRAESPSAPVSPPVAPEPPPEPPEAVSEPPATQRARDARKASSLADSSRSPSYPLDDAEVEQWLGSLNGAREDPLIRTFAQQVDELVTTHEVDPTFAAIVILQVAAKAEAAA